MTDLFDAATERDRALEQVERPPWKDIAWDALQTLPSGTWTGEGIRIFLTRSIGKPHHHNAWGALIMRAVRNKVLTPTGRYVSMREKQSHARKTPEYVK